MFQSTRPRGARLMVFGTRFLNSSFQSTRPRGARLAMFHASEKFPCFNPRAHEGRDSASVDISNKLSDVSIHAPTRGATTIHSIHTPLILNVSIHAPTRGATLVGRERRFEDACFNPRAHEGRDITEGETTVSLQVSIHAPTRGATPYYLRSHGLRLSFQSTRPRGARLITLSPFFFRNSVSIHAPTRGATHFSLLFMKKESSFNPRAHEGRDPLLPAVAWTAFVVSIHAPTRGATSKE